MFETDTIFQHTAAGLELMDGNPSQSMPALISQCYEESFFSGSEYFHPEIAGGRQGVVGDPMPYTIAGDNFMTSMLLLCFVMTAFALRGMGGFIGRQFKSLMNLTRVGATEITQTSSEVRLQIILILEVCLMSGILFFYYLRNEITDTFIIGQSQMIFVFSAAFVVFFSLKNGLYQLVNAVFFDKKKNKLWVQSFFFTTAMFGFLLVPLVFIQSFFDLPDKVSFVCILSILIFYQISVFYIEEQIFFGQKGSFLRFFLYFCMLEIIPIVMMWYVLVVISEYYNINF